MKQVPPTMSSRVAQAQQSPATQEEIEDFKRRAGERFSYYLKDPPPECIVQRRRELKFSEPH